MLNPAVVRTRGGLPIAARLLLVAIAIGYGFVFARDPMQSDWYRCFVQAAQRMQAGETVHLIDERPYAYPPIMAMLTIPLARLGPHFGIWVWYLVNLMAAAVLFRSAWRLIDGPPLWKRYSCLTTPTAEQLLTRRRWQWTAVVACLLASRFLLSAFETRQFDLVIAALLTAGCLHLVEARALRGAFMLGLAAGMKCTPLLFLSYLLWRGRWGISILVAMTALAVNVLPDICYPQQDGDRYLADWNETFLTTAGRVPPGTWFSGLIQNQSLAGEVQRFARYGFTTSTEVIGSAKLPREVVPTLRAVVYALAVVLLLITVCCGGRFGKSWQREAVASSPERLRFAAEVSAVFALMLLLSPMTSRAHYVILLLPTLLIVRSAFVERDDAAPWLVKLLVLFGPLVSKGLVGPTFGQILLAWGFPVWYAAVCLAGSWRMLLAREASKTTLIFSRRFSSRLPAISSERAVLEKLTA